MQKLKTNDEVIVLAGKDKGKQGKLIKLLKDKDGNLNFALVEGVNMIKKHEKPNPSMNIPGGIKEMEAKLNISNIAIVNAVTGKKDKVMIKEIDKKRVRCYKSNGEVIDV